MVLNDIILTGSDTMVVDKFVMALAHQFSIKDLGRLSYFLRVEFLDSPLFTKEICDRYSSLNKNA